MKIIENKHIYHFWEKGYLYLCIAAIVYLAYTLSEGFGIYDWQKEIAYFQYIRESLLSFHTIPYFWWNTLDAIASYPAIAHTSNFIGNAETWLFSPFTPVLMLLHEIAFIKFLIFIHFLIGMAGVLVLRQQLRWNDLQFRIYSILFFFSPLIIQRLSVGYTPWLNLFFFPWIIYFIAHRDAILRVLGTSIVLALVLLQGGTHPFVWFASFVLLYFVLNAFLQRDWRCLFQLFCILGVAFFLSLIRIYSTAQAYGDFHQHFQAGYNPLNFLFWALIPPVLIPPFDAFFMKMVWLGAPSWDAGLFWGAALPMLVILLMRYRKYKDKGSRRDTAVALNFTSLLITSSVLFFFSFFSSLESIVKGINGIYYIPFLEGVEKYPFHFAIPAFLGYSVAMAHFSRDIFQDAQEWMVRKVSIHSMEKLINAVRYGALIFFAAGSLFLAGSILFSKTILGFFSEIIRQAYHGTGNQWLARFMEGKSQNPLEHYLYMAHDKYEHIQIGLAVIVFFLLLAYLLIQNRAKLSVFFKGSPYVKYECVLAVPLLFSVVMWLLLATSTPFGSYQTQDIVPPQVITQAGFPEPGMAVTPKTLTICPGIPPSPEYTLPGILFSDAKFLAVTSGNAVLSASADGSLTIIPQSENIIVLDFCSNRYDIVLIFTIIFWAAVMVFVALKRFPPRGLKN